MKTNRFSLAIKYPKGSANPDSHVVLGFLTLSTFNIGKVAATYLVGV